MTGRPHPTTPMERTLPMSEFQEKRLVAACRTAFDVHISMKRWWAFYVLEIEAQRSQRLKPKTGECLAFEAAVEALRRSENSIFYCRLPLAMVLARELTALGLDPGSFQRWSVGRVCWIECVVLGSNRDARVAQ